MGRFLNADGYASTGQSVQSCNMFAYCENNPINRCDPSGQFWLAAIAVVAVVTAATVGAVTISNDSAPKSDVGAARPYEYVKGSIAPNAVNCYAYAIGAKWYKQPGYWSGRKPEDWSDVYDVGQSVKEDLISKGYTVREVSGPNAKVYDNEYKIALRVGTKPCGINVFTGALKYDYHFMVQTSTGQWAEKHGRGGDSILWDKGMTPNEIPWTADGIPYYDSDILYYAIGS